MQLRPIIAVPDFDGLLANLPPRANRVKQAVQQEQPIITLQELGLRRAGAYVAFRHDEEHDLRYCKVSHGIFGLTVVRHSRELQHRLQRPAGRYPAGRRRLWVR